MRNGVYKEAYVAGKIFETLKGYQIKYLEMFSHCVLSVCFDFIGRIISVHVM